MSKLCVIITKVCGACGPQHAVSNSLSFVNVLWAKKKKIVVVIIIIDLDVIINR